MNHAPLRNALRTLFALVLCGLGLPATAIVTHPMDPLEDTEILNAAFILQGAGAAQPGAIFQSIDLREPPEGVGARRSIRAIRSPARQRCTSGRTRRATGRSSTSTTARSRRRVQIPKSDGQLGLTITEVSDFSFAFQDPAFLQALARRGITTPDQLANVLVTPLTPGSFGLPEESRRIVKAQMYYRENAAINLYASPIEGVQAIIDLDDRVVLQVIDTGVAAARAQTQRIRRGDGERALRAATGAEAHQGRAATGCQLHARRQLRRVAEVEVPRALRAPARHGDLARHLRRPARDVSGFARGDLRTVPGSRHPLVLPDLHGRGRVRLRASVVAAQARPRRAGERGAAATRSCRPRFRIRRFPSCRCRCRRSSASSSASPAIRRGATSSSSQGRCRPTKAARTSSSSCARSRSSATTTTWSTGSSTRAARFASKSR